MSLVGELALGMFAAMRGAGFSFFSFKGQRYNERWGGGKAEKEKGLGLWGEATVILSDSEGSWVGRNEILRCRSE